jgi:hypothetical protein
LSLDLRVDTNNRSGSVSGKGATSVSAGGGASFEPASAGSTARAAAPAFAASATGIDALLALQAVEDPLFAKKKAVRRGQSLLGVLEEIKADLLVGHVGEGRLNQLMALISQARQQSVPGLDSLIDDIELRARVELAKFGRFPPA